MRKEKLERIYDMIINNGHIITKRTFLMAGISKPQKEIDDLLADGTLVIVEKGKYKLASVEGLYAYGLNLFSKGQILRANLCFEKCHSIDPTHRDSCLQTFLLAFKNKKYLNAYEILDIIMTIEPEKYGYENNLLLYLLSVVSDECPSRYEQKVQNMELEDVLSPAETNHEVKAMKTEIMKGKYPHAMYLFNNICAKNLKYTVSKAVLKELISQAIYKEQGFRQHIASLVDKKEYHLLVSTLEQKNNRRHLNIYDEQIYMIVQAIVSIQDTKTIPPLQTTDTNDLYKALQGNNFTLALQINQRFVKYTQNTKSAEILQKLLIDIIQLITELETEQKQNVNNLQTNISVEEIPSLSPTDVLKNTEEMAYYLKEIDFSTDFKSLGLLPEQLLLIKLVYARDYYIEGNYEAGDKLVKEVEQSFKLSDVVIKLIAELKANRNNYQQQSTSHTRSLVPSKSSYNQEESC